MSVYQLLYVSNATPQFKSSDISSILEAAHEHNSKHNITGILLYRSGIFLQLLEGNQGDVQGIYQKISKDPRHANLIRLFETNKNSRIFTDWSMAFRELDDLDLKMINEVLSWNKLVKAHKEVPNELVIELISRFRTVIKPPLPSAM